jgi:hypothetical protein
VLLIINDKRLDILDEANICTVSFCTEPDLLNQWRGYTGSGTGYAIGFYSRGLKEIARDNACLLGKCIYEKATQEQIISDSLTTL